MQACFCDVDRSGNLRFRWCLGGCSLLCYSLLCYHRSLLLNSALFHPLGPSLGSKNQNDPSRNPQSWFPVSYPDSQNVAEEQLTHVPEQALLLSFELFTSNASRPLPIMLVRKIIRAWSPLFNLLIIHSRGLC